MKPKEFKIEVTFEGKRLDAFLCDQLPNVTRLLVRKAVKEGCVKVNDISAKAGQVLQAGDLVFGSIEKRAIAARPDLGKERLPLDILFEDQHLIAVNKPREIHSVTLLENDPVTLADALGAYNACFLTASNDPREAGLVQRLDFFTSGLVLAAKSKNIWKQLHRAFSEGDIVKDYLALVEGEIPSRGKTIRTGFLSKGERVQPIEEDEAIKKGLSIKISFCKTERLINKKEKKFSLVRVTTTGAYRHQVRAHLAYLGLPIVGDNLYGSSVSLSDLGIDQEKGFLLHATSLCFNHPATEREIKLSCKDNIIANL